MCAFADPYFAQSLIEKKVDGMCGGAQETTCGAKDLALDVHVSDKYTPWEECPGPAVWQEKIMNSCYLHILIHYRDSIRQDLQDALYIQRPLEDLQASNCYRWIRLQLPEETSGTEA